LNTIDINITTLPSKPYGTRPIAQKTLV